MRNQKYSRVNTAKGRKISSTNWLNRHINDPYTNAAKREGYRSRAAYKLLEINDKFSILQKKGIIVDLGSSPGGWSQVAVKCCKKVIAIDIIGMDEISNVTFMQYDFMKMNKDIFPTKVDVILSDMSPPTCGHPSTDHARIISLSEEVLKFAQSTLKMSGSVVTKIFHGSEEKRIRSEFQQHFEMLKYYKPNASRKNSNEIYLVAMKRKV